MSFTTACALTGCGKDNKLNIETKMNIYNSNKFLHIGSLVVKISFGNNSICVIIIWSVYDRKNEHRPPILHDAVIFSMKIGLLFRVIKRAAPSPWKIYDGFGRDKEGAECGYT